MRGTVVLLMIAMRLTAFAIAVEPASAPRVLTKAGEIAAEVTPPDTPPARVVFEGPVSYQDPMRTIFVVDDTGVTFVFGFTVTNPLVQSGDRIRVTGVAHQGVIIGGIRPDRIEVIGRGAPPPAVPVEPRDLATGRYHYHRVAIEGVVWSVAAAGDSAVVLTLRAAGQRVRIEVEAPAAEAEAAAERLVDARVRATGLVVGNINDRRQVVDPFIRVKQISDVEVLDPPPTDAFAIVPTPLDALASQAIGDHRVRVRGTAVAKPLAGAVYLREGARSVRVRLAATAAANVRPGDLVEAVGFPDMGTYSVELGDALIRVAGAGTPPAPRPALAKRRRDLDRPDADLVQVEGVVLDVGGESRVVVRHGEIDYTIEPPPGTQVAAPPDSLVRATGVCRVAAVEGDSYRAFPRAYTLLLESPAAFTVIRSAPWWTPQRILIAVAAGLAGLGAIVGLAAAWIVLLRRQVRTQLAVIEGNIQAEAVAEERRRIAREFHDSVNQGLAAAALRLDAAAYRLTDERSKAVLDRQRRLLATLQSEAREFIWDLRDPVHADAPLAVALTAQLGFLAKPPTTTIEFEPPPAGTDPAADLPPEVRHQIVRIVREAVSNAVRHAKANRITVRLAAGDRGGLTIEITDDGTGFDVAARAAAEGHFGIRGMQERARRIGSALTIESSQGSGTCVILALGQRALPAPITTTSGGGPAGGESGLRPSGGGEPLRDPHLDDRLASDTKTPRLSVE
jgi:signal transduction histidine kinase